MADGMWTMSEDGEFHLEEPYRTWLEEAKVESTRGWHNALVAYLEQRSPYTAQELSDELQNEVRKNLVGAYLSLSKHAKMFFNGGADTELEDFEEELYGMFTEYVKKFS